LRAYVLGKKERSFAGIADTFIYGTGGERGEKDWNKTKANKERKTDLL